MSAIPHFDLVTALCELEVEVRQQPCPTDRVLAAMEKVARARMLMLEDDDNRRAKIKRGLSRLGHQPECVSVGCHDAHCHCGSCLEVRLNDSY